LGEAVARLAGQPLQRLVQHSVLQPIGMRDTCYAPPRSRRPRIAPTEEDGWRGRLVHGEVHDENAAVMGGIAGHAGLFGTGPDLARFAGCLMHEGMAGGRRVFSADVCHEFLMPAELLKSRTWALGWSGPRNWESTGHYFSPCARGHFGYTGTSLWIDFPRRLAVILLTNRVHPSRENTGIHDFRRSVHDLIFEHFRGPAF
jgi:CubicO group peptidase (beta-lactamase class C family)